MFKNIIFDLGGVILNLDYRLTDLALKELLGISFEGRKYPKNFISLFNNYEKGSLTEASFFNSLQALANKQIDHSLLIAAWNKMLLDLPEPRLDMLLSLRSEYRVVLLSNTNFTHLTEFYKNLKTRHVHDFDRRYFDRTFYSHELGMRKPDKEIFQYVLSACNFKASESLFIDDNIENVSGARSAGIESILHIPNSPISQKIWGYLGLSE